LNVSSIETPAARFANMSPAALGRPALYREFNP
jgi:hypothetical protein